MNFETIQFIYYVLGINTMSLGLLLLITVAVLVFYIYKKVNHIISIVEDKVEDVKKIVDHPADSAYSLGTKIAEAAIDVTTRKKKISGRSGSGRTK